MPQIACFRPSPSDPPLELPSGIIRTVVHTPQGNLELLVAEPKPTDDSSTRKSPIFLAHGGCGSAAVWIEWMLYFSQRHDIPCYAVSYRGRGQSWNPGFWLLLFTRKDALAGDLCEGLKEAAHIESEKRLDVCDEEDISVDPDLEDSAKTSVKTSDPSVDKAEARKQVDFVLVGHSSGGGLCQLVLSGDMNTGDANITGLVLAASIPCFGNDQVNKNWLAFDPWFFPRMLMHLFHPMSPLSSTALVKQAFFCSDFPAEKVVEFEKRMPRYESLAWPMGMAKRFVDCVSVMRRLYGGGSTLGDSKERLIILAAEKDRLCSVGLMERMAGEYRVAGAKLLNRSGMGQGLGVAGVRFEKISGAGHHLQNDMQWEAGAAKILEFHKQVF